MKLLDKKKSLIKKIIQTKRDIEKLDIDKIDGDKINEIITELSECREDSRNCENIIIQIVSAARTILGLIFGVSGILPSETEEVASAIEQAQQINGRGYSCNTTSTTNGSCFLNFE